MMNYSQFHGIMPPIPTPMRQDRSLDLSAMQRLVNFLVEGGINSMVVNGTIGEFYALTEEERTQNATLVINEVKGRLPVVVGTGHSGTIPAVELAKTAEGIGASAVQVMPPYYILPTDDGIYEHYAAIAKAIEIPIFVYNNPGTTKIDMSASLIARLAEIDNVIGIKLSPAGKMSPVETALGIRQLTKKRPELVVMIASAGLWFFGMEMGIANGCVMGLPNVFPVEYAQVYKMICEGRVADARKLNNTFFELDHLAITETGSRARYPHVYKTLLMWRGILPSNAVREPMMPIEEFRLRLLRTAFDTWQANH